MKLEEDAPGILFFDKEDENTSFLSSAIENSRFKLKKALNTIAAIDCVKQNSSQISVVVIGPESDDIDPEMFLRGIQDSGAKNIPQVFMVESEDDVMKWRDLMAKNSATLAMPVESAKLVYNIKLLMHSCNQIFAKNILKYEDVLVNTVSKQVMRGGHHISLAPVEFRILCLLINCPSTVFSRRQIIKHAWDKDAFDVEARIIDVHINRLRNALKVDKLSKKLIHTVRGIGYCFDVKIKQKAPALA